MLGAEDLLKESAVVRADWTQRTEAMADAEDGCGNGIKNPMGGGGFPDHGERIQVAAIGRKAELDAAADIDDAFAQISPTHLFTAAAGDHPTHAEAFRIVDCGLDSQYGAGLVLHFDRVLFHPMFDPNAFDACAQMRPDFPVKLGRLDASAEKPQYVLATKLFDGMPQQCRIDPA
jgi:hypothetical protein